MNNRELATALLNEAVELLNESGARKKYLQHLGEKQDSLNAEKEANLKKLEKEPAKREIFGKNPVKSHIDTAKMKLKDRKLDKEIKGTEDAARKYSARVTPDSISAMYEDDYVEHGNWVSHRKDRKAKEEFNKDFGGKKPKNAKLHERVNKRGELFKSQNESIAKLLIESAELLRD